MEGKIDNKNYIVINGKKAELTEEQLKQLGIEVSKNKRERVKVGDMFFFVDRSNCIDLCIDNRVPRSNYCYDTHNYFKTKEEAQEYAKVLEIKRQLMKIANKYNDFVDWNDRVQEKWFFKYHIDAGVTISFVCYAKYAETIYFSSKEIAEQAIDEIGEDNIKKYLTYEW